jgi:ABC-2 type transport system ATP-binding protein
MLELRRSRAKCKGNGFTVTVTNSDARIVVDDLHKVYEPTPVWMRALVRTNIKEPVYALNGVSFTVHTGEIVAVVGPNGAGKTTTFKIIGGLTTPTGGSARIMGFDSIKQSVQVRRAIGWMPGDHRTLLMRHSVLENMRFHGRLQGMSGSAMLRRIRETLEMVGLDHRARSNGFSLSAGMLARLQLARAILHKPEILILDEPTGAVDPVAAHDLIQLIKGIVAETGVAVLISSHRLEEIETLDSRVLLLDEGRVRYDGRLEDLRRLWDRPTFEIDFRTTASAEAAAGLLRNAGFDGVSSSDGTIAFALRDGVTHADLLSRLRDQLEDMTNLRETRRPLQAVLADLYRTKEPAQ